MNKKVLKLFKNKETNIKSPCSILTLSYKRLFSIDWNYLNDIVMLFEFCFILLQPVLTFLINFFKVLLIWLYKRFYVDKKSHKI